MTENTEHPRKTPNSGNVDIARRNFSRIGAASPVLLSLASMPVFGSGGAPCLSNMMSGHLYQDRGHCSYGWNPSEWMDLNGGPGWNFTPFRPCIIRNGKKVYFDGSLYYLNKKDKQKPCSNKHGHKKDACYVDADPSELCTLQEALDYYGILSCGNLGDYFDSTLIELLEDNLHNSIGYFVTALLNASHSDITYIMTPQQVVDVYCGTTGLPGGHSADTFFQATWGG